MTTSRSNGWEPHALVFWRLLYNTSFYSPKYWYQKTSARAPVITSYSCTDAHSYTYTQARNLQLVESCKVSSLCPSTKPADWVHPSLAAPATRDIPPAATMHAARKLLPSQQHNVSKKIFSMATAFVKCKVHWIQLLTWAEAERRRKSRSADHPGGCHGILAGKKYFRYLEKGGFGRIVSNHLWIRPCNVHINCELYNSLNKSI